MKGPYSGSKGLYVLFAFLNFLLMLSSVGGIICASWYFHYSHDADEFNVTLMIISVALLILSTVAFFLRKHENMLMVYLAMLVALFIAEMTFTIIMYVDSDRVIHWVEENNYDDPEIINEFNEHFDEIKGCFIAFTVILVRNQFAFHFLT